MLGHLMQLHSGLIVARIIAVFTLKPLKIIKKELVKITSTLEFTFC